MMNNYEVGRPIPGLQGAGDSIRIDISDSGAVLYSIMSDPTESEVNSYKSGQPYEIRFVKLDGVIMFTLKFGGQPWVDAPYHPKLSKNLTTLQEPADGEGLSLTVVLVDARTGIVKNIRLIGLSTHFTKKLYAAIREAMAEPFDINSYYRKIPGIYRKYSTKDIVKLSRDYCKG